MIIIPPTKIKNRIYENQNLFVAIPVIMHVNKVWTNKINPIVIGWLVWIIKIEFIIIKIIRIWVISENSLFKILILEIKDNLRIFSDILKKNFIFDLQNQCFY